MFPQSSVGEERDTRPLTGGGRRGAGGESTEGGEGVWEGWGRGGGVRWCAQLETKIKSTMSPLTNISLFGRIEAFRYLSPVVETVQETGDVGKYHQSHLFLIVAYTRIECKSLLYCT